MSKWLAGSVGLFVFIAYISIYPAIPVEAETLQSPNYRFDESSIGTDSLLQSSSANYQASSATGALSVGSALSAQHQIETGTETTNDPTLSFSLESADANFGTFTPSETSVATAKFSVSNYTSFGYVIQIAGKAPSNGSYTIAGMATAGPPQAGVDQFGINLVANTLPKSLGANPDNGDFGFGSAASNYDTSNAYRYVSGDTVAFAPKSSGKTIYTISYIVNVGSLTPGGQYKSNQTMVITGTY